MVASGRGGEAFETNLGQEGLKVATCERPLKRRSSSLVSARRMILARITSQYRDVYFLAIVSNLTRSSLESLTVNGLLLGIGGRSLPIASVSECPIASAPITRHRIYEWEYLA